VTSPLLINKHKFEIRTYVLVASTNPLIVYFYKGGFLSFALRKFNGCSKRVDVHFPKLDISTYLVDKARKEPIYGMTAAELINLRKWTIFDLAKYLKDNGKIAQSAKKWINKKLIPELETALIHLFRMSQDTFLQRSQLFEFLAVDFVMDDSLNVWFMDVTPNPTLKPMNSKFKTAYKKMLKDMFEIVQKYLRSRVRRIVKFVNELSQEVEVTRDEKTGEDKVLIPEYFAKKDAFQIALRNKLEKKDALTKDNKFQKIIDENYDGFGRYNKLLKKACF